MRPLVMDFRNDSRADNIGDQFMYGPAFLVNPVTEPAATTRQLYLPESKWYDFWTGSDVGGRTDDQRHHASGPDCLSMCAPDRSCLSDRSRNGPRRRQTIRSNCEFTLEPMAISRLYEDENDTYDYEKGAYATIPLHWDDSAHTLTIGDRKGQFPGMLESRTFHVVFVRENHGVGESRFGSRPTKSCEYSGQAGLRDPLRKSYSTFA